MAKKVRKYNIKERYGSVGFFLKSTVLCYSFTFIYRLHTFFSSLANLHLTLARFLFFLAHLYFSLSLFPTFFPPVPTFTSLLPTFFPPLSTSTSPLPTFYPPLPHLLLSCPTSFLLPNPLSSLLGPLYFFFGLSPTFFPPLPTWTSQSSNSPLPTSTSLSLTFPPPLPTLPPSQLLSPTFFPLLSTSNSLSPTFFPPRKSLPPSCSIPFLPCSNRLFFQAKGPGWNYSGTQFLDNSTRAAVMNWLLLDQEPSWYTHHISVQLVVFSNQLICFSLCIWQTIFYLGTFGKLRPLSENSATVRTTHYLPPGEESCGPKQAAWQQWWRGSFQEAGKG